MVLGKKLGVIYEGNPMCVQLNFKPKGIGKRGSLFYEAEMENRCVVCGSNTNLLRHGVIPSMYRRHFPIAVKTHSWHDLVLLCLNCHRLADQHNDILKQQIANELGIPVSFESDESKVLWKAKWAAKALTKSKKIPEARRSELLELVRKYTKTSEVTEKQLQELAATQGVSDTQKYSESHGRMVVSRLIAEGTDGEMDLYATADNIFEFCVRWRKNFVDKMDPKFLALNWDIYHRKPV